MTFCQAILLINRLHLNDPPGLGFLRCFRALTTAPLSAESSACATTLFELMKASIANVASSILQVLQAIVMLLVYKTRKGHANDPWHSGFHGVGCLHLLSLAYPAKSLWYDKDKCEDEQDSNVDSAPTEGSRSPGTNGLRVITCYHIPCKTLFIVKCKTRSLCV